jgi:magnesium chelatase accessory protein
LQPLARDLPRLATPLVMLVAEGDSTVSPAEARRVRTLLPTVEVQTIPRLGHLAHEEAPQTVASLIRSIAQHYRK